MHASLLMVIALTMVETLASWSTNVVADTLIVSVSLGIRLRNCGSGGLESRTPSTIYRRLSRLALAREIRQDKPGSSQG